MKKITLTLIFALMISAWAYCQCTIQSYQYPTSTVTISATTGAQTISTNNWRQNEYSVIDGLVIGNTYTVFTDLATFITVTEADGSTVIVFGDNSVSFTATTTGIVCYWSGDSACTAGDTSSTWTQIECTSCVCNEFTAPSAATNDLPLDGSIDVAIDYSDPDNLLITPFSWIDGTTGGSIESTNLSLGTTTAGNDIGTITGATNGNGIIYTWAENTTYYWYIESVNCVGSTQSPIWSFTTGSCTETAAPGVQASSPTPADLATGVAIQAPDGGVTFNWTGSSNADDSYTLNIGTTNPPTQAITGVEPGVFITGLSVSTTYYWSIDVINCFGTTTGTSVWSFTTDSTLGLEDTLESNETFSAYPNPTSGILNIKSSQEVDNVTVFNLLGQNVASFTKNEISNSSIDMSSLSKGLYLVKVTSGDKTQTLRVTKE